MITTMAVARLGALVVVAVALTLCAGCGSSGPRTSAKSPAPASGSPGGAGSGTQTIPTPAPTGIPPDPAAVRVIRAWSSALRGGDVRRAAAYFALPSVMVNGVGSNGALSVTAIRTRVAADAANASLPCGAQFISADQRGRYVNALFVLTDRPGRGGGCGSGIGQTARTNFVIGAGRIVEWIRAPDDPGDNRGPAPPTAPVPTTPKPPSPVI
jgi:ABC-type phosphate transport system substrate-binding protein